MRVAWRANIFRLPLAQSHMVMKGERDKGNFLVLQSNKRLQHVAIDASADLSSHSSMVAMRL